MSTDITQERIRSVIAGLLAALAKTLLRCGVSYAEFADLSKKAFVDAASADYGVRNRPTNIARVAVMTGLSRKEVSKIRREKRRRKRIATQTNVTLPAAILQAWHTNPRYQLKSGEPRVLPFSGAGLSFSSLVRSISRDIPPGAMRHELVRAGAVRRIDRVQLMPTKRYFVPDSADDRILVGLELGLRRLAETVAFNSEPDRNRELKFQRFVEGPRFNRAELSAVRKKINATLADISLGIDDLLVRCGRRATRSKSSENPEYVDVGVGIYYFDESVE